MSLAKHIKKTRKREIVTERKSGYADNCVTGFHHQGSWQAHHIVCVSSVGKRKADYPNRPPELADYLEACLWVTPWNINDSANLIGLPMNRQHWLWEGTQPEDLPSHQVDHNTREGYTDEVSQYLAESVWNCLTAKKTVHDVDVAKLKKELEDASTEFRNKLTDRGQRNGGTKLCWSKRFESDAKDMWYRPFSMGRDPNPRSPGLPSMASLEGLFKKIRLSF